MPIRIRGMVRVKKVFTLYDHDQAGVLGSKPRKFGLGDIMIKVRHINALI